MIFRGANNRYAHIHDPSMSEHREYTPIWSYYASGAQFSYRTACDHLYRDELMPILSRYFIGAGSGGHELGIRVGVSRSKMLGMLEEVLG